MGGRDQRIFVPGQDGLNSHMPSQPKPQTFEVIPHPRFLATGCSSPHGEHVRLMLSEVLDEYVDGGESDPDGGRLCLVLHPEELEHD